MSDKRREVNSIMPDHLGEYDEYKEEKKEVIPTMSVQTLMITQYLTRNSKKIKIVPAGFYFCTCKMLGKKNNVSNYI